MDNFVKKNSQSMVAKRKNMIEWSVAGNRNEITGCLWVHIFTCKALEKASPRPFLRLSLSPLLECRIVDSPSVRGKEREDEEESRQDVSILFSGVVKQNHENHVVRTPGTVLFLIGVPMKV